MVRRTRRGGQLCDATIRLTGVGALALVSLAAPSSHGSVLDDAGITALRNRDSSLTGSGVFVAQVEGSNPGAYDFEVDPTSAGVAASLLTYYSTNGGSLQVVTGSPPPNAAGIVSQHAITVAQNFYGPADGVATGVAHVDNYDAQYFEDSIISLGTNVTAKVINQTFSNGGTTTSIDQEYDAYIRAYDKVVLSAAGNGGSIVSPATCFNGIAVGAYATGLSTGPAYNGALKPDIVMPSNINYDTHTSFAVPYVSGAAAILVQAGTRGDGGAGTAADATNHLTIKALLLAGAAKPAGWVHSATAPLDSRWGAGVMNADASDQILLGGEHHANTSQAIVLNAAHPAATGQTAQPSLLGWDHATLSSSTLTDAVAHYVFTLPNTGAGTSYTLSSTLAWDRQTSPTVGVNNLDLFLYDVNSGSQIDLSTSALVDGSTNNVEALYTQNLTPGDSYDLQVLKHGGSSEITTSETYSLAYQFTAVPEPASLGFLTLAGALLTRPRRRRT